MQRCLENIIGTLVHGAHSEEKFCLLGEVSMGQREEAAGRPIGIKIFSQDLKPCVLEQFI